MARFRIEYLRETTDEHSVCHVIAARAATLSEAGQTAFAGFTKARQLFEATGFQIRDLGTEAGPVVALETIDTSQG